MVVKKKVTKRKKPVSRKKTPRILRQKNPIALNEFKKIFLGIAILVSLCLTLAMIADIFLQPQGTKKETVQKASEQTTIEPIQEGIQNEIIKKIPAKGLKEKVQKPNAQKGISQNPVSKEPAMGKPIEYEVFKDVDQTAIKKPVPPIKDRIPKIAIIIDDIGYDRKTAIALSELHPDITFSVLPFAPYGKSLSERLHKKGAQLMLHLPMEPVEYPSVDPGPGAILSHMPPDVLLGQLKKAIQNIPYIIGVNNHMGSRLTMQANKMNQIFTILKKEDLFFIDSRTAPKSACKASARLLQIKFAQRDVFLDNIQETKYITGQFKVLLKLAKKHGFAIGIGHPYPTTLETLVKEIPKLKNKITIVRASELTSVLR